MPRQDFDRDGAVQPGITRTIHRPHSGVAVQLHVDIAVLGDSGNGPPDVIEAAVSECRDDCGRRDYTARSAKSSRQANTRHCRASKALRRWVYSTGELLFCLTSHPQCRKVRSVEYRQRSVRFLLHPGGLLAPQRSSTTKPTTKCHPPP